MAVSDDEEGWSKGFATDMMGTVRLVDAAMPGMLPIWLWSMLPWSMGILPLAGLAMAVAAVAAAIAAAPATSERRLGL
jgi:hypothetical protein